MNTFNLTVISLKEILFNGSVVLVSVPGIKGKLTILKNHIPLITLLKTGQIKIKSGETETLFNIQRGLLEVNPLKTTILVS